MEKTLIKTYRNKAVFFVKPNRIVVETIDDNALKILDFYKKIKKI